MDESGDAPYPAAEVWEQVQGWMRDEERIVKSLIVLTSAPTVEISSASTPRNPLQGGNDSA